MIIQGSNNPITVILDVVPSDISVTLCNEIQELKHWDMENMTASTDNLTYTAEYTQAESMSWEEGPCEVIVRWTDSTGDKAGIVQTERVRDVIEYCMDETILNEE